MSKTVHWSKYIQEIQTSIQVVMVLVFLIVSSSIGCRSFDSELEIISTTASMTIGSNSPALRSSAIVQYTLEPSGQITPMPMESSAVPTRAAMNSKATQTKIPTSSKLFVLKRGDPGWRPHLSKLGNWINSTPLKLDSLLSSGKVVLVDFWTYTCINCVRTLPYLQLWHQKYADRGLVILGIHSPEFIFEQKYENVVQAVADFGLEYPVAQDNEHGTWRAFSNRYWPAKYLIDPSGSIRYSHFGEGAYDDTEQQIRALLAEAGHDLEGISATVNLEPLIDPRATKAPKGMGRTRELYAGYERNFDAMKWLITQPYVYHAEYYDMKDEAVSYIDSGIHENHLIYLHGLWRNHAESLVHARHTEEYEDYIAIKFFATSVNAVIASNSGEPYKVQIMLDNSPVPITKSAVDIQYDKLGNSFININSPRLYYLIDQTTFTGGELKLSSNSPEFSLFTFTFGDYMGGEP